MRVAYLKLFATSAITAALMRVYGQYVLVLLSSILHNFSECDAYPDDGYCLGNQLVYRMSFSIGCLFLLTGLLGCISVRGGETACCFLAVQVPFYVVLTIASFFIPDGFFNRYADVARVASAAFVILQIIILVDWADSFSEKIKSVDRDVGARRAIPESNDDPDFFLDNINSVDHDPEARRLMLESNDDPDFFSEKIESVDCDAETRIAIPESNENPIIAATGDSNDRTSAWEGAFLLALVFLLGAAACSGIVMMLMFHGGCGLNRAFIALTIITIVMIVVLCVLSRVGVGLLPSIVVVCYLVWLSYEAVRANPDETCAAYMANPPSTTIIPAMDQSSHPGSFVFNVILAALTITWTSWRTSGTKSHLSSTWSSGSYSSLEPSLSPSHHKPAVSDDSPCNLADGSTVNDEPNEDNNSVAPVPEYQFHALMVLSSLYMAMTITNWGSANGMNTDDDRVVTMWVKIASQWISAAIFIWTLVAPSVRPNRADGVKRAHR